jgi:hypothetical protein
LGLNQLKGPLPSVLGRLLKLLEFDIQETHGLTGQSPPDYGNLECLERIDIWDNNLTGKIPSEFAPTFPAYAPQQPPYTPQQVIFYPPPSTHQVVYFTSPPLLAIF